MNKKWIFLYILACSYSIFFLEVGETLAEGLNGPLLCVSEEGDTQKEITWMELNIPVGVMNQALAYDIESYQTETPLNWIELLAYGAAKNWGAFPNLKKCKEIDQLVEKLRTGESMETLTKDLKLYTYYFQTYSAVFNGYVGEYEIEEEDPETPGQKIFVKKYGLKAFSPVAKGYSYTHYNDFGNTRSYGYKRKHLGNDIMGRVGTPIIAIEDGIVEALGWNQYGGWRIGIRSYDHKRYYYYAHLRKDHPFPKDLQEGSQVQAGDVVGYLGMTGYSAKENVNNIKIPHLHFGLQIIFDEAQKDGSNQIWLDVYNLVEFLAKHRMPVIKDEISGDYKPVQHIHSIAFD